jgi:hypothetical protein
MTISRFYLEQVPLPTQLGMVRLAFAQITLNAPGDLRHAAALLPIAKTRRHS